MSDLELVHEKLLQWCAKSPLICGSGYMEIFKVNSKFRLLSRCSSLVTVSGQPFNMLWLEADGGQHRGTFTSIFTLQCFKFTGFGRVPEVA